MISIEDRKLFARAEAKARTIKPRVRMIEFGTYEVASSQADKSPYTVKFEKTTTGHWAASCTCKAHTGDNRPGYQPKACFHIPSAYAAHKIQVGIRQQVRAAQEAAPAPVTPPICNVCSFDAQVWTGSEWLCWQHALQAAEARDKEAKTAEDIATAERLYPDLLEPINQATKEYTKAQALYDRACLFG